MSELPSFNPNISHLKRQAKELKRAAETGDPEALTRPAAAGVEPDGLPSLGGAQLTIAREYSFAGWQELIEEAGERMVDLGDIHRWFGVHLNNEAWKVIDEQTVSPDDQPRRHEEALYRTFASVYHWMQVGNPMNHGRGEHLTDGGPGRVYRTRRSPCCPIPRTDRRPSRSGGRLGTTPSPTKRWRVLWPWQATVVPVRNVSRPRGCAPSSPMKRSESLSKRNLPRSPGSG